MHTKDTNFIVYSLHRTTTINNLSDAPLDNAASDNASEDNTQADASSDDAASDNALQDNTPSPGGAR
jgi:hypothetical protein